MTDARLIQVPWYLGREHPDLSRGPGVLAEAIGGDTVVVAGPEPRPVPNEVADSFDVIRSVRASVRATVEDGRFPLVLAVNCFTSLGTVAGVGREVGVVWFDAHGDLHTPDSTITGFLDGMGLAMLLGDGWRELRSTVEGLRPVPAANALLVAARDLEPTELERVDASACAGPTQSRSRPRSTSWRRGSTPSTSTSTSTSSIPRWRAPTSSRSRAGSTPSSSSRRSQQSRAASRSPPQR